MAESYEKTDTRFVNPYHFVPLDERGCAKTIDRNTQLENGDSFTGYIDCTLVTLTPLFIPDTSRSCGLEHGIVKRYDFYSRESGTECTHSPIIPGSSLRGAIRTVFEALTRSCLSSVDTDHYLYKRTTEPAKPGRLVYNRESGSWQIHPCIKHMVPRHLSKGLRDRQSVRFKVAKRYKNRSYMPYEVSEIDTPDCNRKGYFHRGEWFQRKHHESIFEIDEKQTPRTIDNDTVRRLLENYRLYQDSAVNQALDGNHHGYHSNLQNASNASLDDLDGFLVYYTKRGTRYYLSPAAIGREVFQNRLHDLIDKENGDFTPCDDLRRLCPACALFGFVSSGGIHKGDALASRIAFGDAKVQGEVRWKSGDGFIVLPELASPKLSATEFYLQRQKNEYHLWNYDYAGQWKNHAIQSDNDYFPKLQGRKFYWHHKEMRSFDEENRKFSSDSRLEYSDRLVAVRPVDSGVHFVLRIHFERVTSDELDRLLWVLDLGGKAELAHKIGMGKPVGLGSARIRVEKTKIRKLTFKEGKLHYHFEDYHRDGKDPGTLFDTSEAVVSAVERILDFRHAPQNITYPYCVDSDRQPLPEHYRWFVANRQIRERATGTSPIIDQNLDPLQTKNDTNLQVIKIVKGEKGVRHRNNGVHSGKQKRSNDALRNEWFRGKVTKYIEDRGFGFIDGSIFFHILIYRHTFSDKMPRKGDEVLYRKEFYKKNGKEQVKVSSFKGDSEG